RDPEGLALPPHRLEGGPPLGGRPRGRRVVPGGARRRPRGAAGDGEDPARAARAPARRGRATRRGDRLHARVARSPGGAARAFRGRAPPLRGTHPRPLPRGGGRRGAADRPRRRDGTYNEAVNGAAGRVPFGFVPGGGASVFPRALGVAREPAAAA